MEKRNDGGPAFPVECSYSEQGTAGKQTSNSTAWEMGMTLRDYFAAKALAGLMADPEVIGSAEDCAAVAYEMADAMIAVREK